MRFAHVSMGCETCAFCLMLASRGAVYHSRKTAGEFMHFHRGCDCKVVPGFEDDPMAVLVEGHDPNDALRQWQRLQNGDVVATGLYAKGGKAVSDSASLIYSKIKAMRQSFNKTDRSAGSWSRTVGEFIESFSASGRVTTELWTNPEGKELQVAGWLARHGVDCVFRNQDIHKKLDGNTSDLLIDGETWDIKRITSSNPKKIATAIFSKELQGPNFVIDLSISDMTESAALAKCASILDDARVERILLIVARKAILLKKRA